MGGSDEEGDAEFLEAFMGKTKKKTKKEKESAKGVGVEIRTKSDGSPIVSSPSYFFWEGERWGEGEKERRREGEKERRREGDKTGSLIFIFDLLGTSTWRFWIGKKLLDCHSDYLLVSNPQRREK
jgi:hypothetical protein